MKGRDSKRVSGNGRRKKLRSRNIFKWAIEAMVRYHTDIEQHEVQIDTQLHLGTSNSPGCSILVIRFLPTYGQRIEVYRIPARSSATLLRECGVVTHLVTDHT